MDQEAPRTHHTERLALFPRLVRRRRPIRVRHAYMYLPLVGTTDL